VGKRILQLVKIDGKNCGFFFWRTGDDFEGIGEGFLQNFGDFFEVFRRKCDHSGIVQIGLVEIFQILNRAQAPVDMMLGNQIRILSEMGLGISVASGVANALIPGTLKVSGVEEDQAGNASPVVTEVAITMTYEKF